MSHLLIKADARRLALRDKSIHCCVTSPPYWGLRDYGVEGQLGLETTPEEYVANMVDVFREVKRVLRDDGTLWLNIGDTYHSGKGASGGARKFKAGEHIVDAKNPARRFGVRPNDRRISGLKGKDLVGVPWMLAFALRADGWYLRQEVIWAKKNCMTESVRDRPSRAHEHVFLLSKASRYFYDIDATREPHTMKPQRRPRGRPTDQTPRPGQPRQGWSTTARDEVAVDGHPLGKNLRSVWSLSVGGFKGAHFATMPAKLAEKCILAGTSEKGCCPRCGSPWRRIVERDRIPTRPGTNSKVNRASASEASPYNGHAGIAVGNRDPHRHTTLVRTVGWESSCSCLEPNPVPCTVLDNFGGVATTVVVAEALGRHGVMTELSDEYLAMARRRLERPHALATPKPTNTEPPMPLFSRRRA